MNPERVTARTLEQITVSRDELMKFLSKNLYEEPEKKLQLWRDLRWIIADKGRMSRRCYDREGKRVRGIAIDLRVCETLKNLQNG